MADPQLPAPPKGYAIESQLPGPPKGYAVEQPGAVSRFLGGVYDSTIGAGISGIKTALGTEDLDAIAQAVKAGDYAKAGTLALQWAGKSPQQRLGTAALEGSKANAQQAAADVRAGKYGRAIEHGAGIVPVIGPTVTDIADTAIDRGDWAGAAGKLTGNAALILGPKAAARVAPKIAAKLPALENPNPVRAEAAQWGVREGINIPADVATGNSFLKIARQASESTIGGSLVGDAARQQLGEQLAAKANELAGRVSPTPQTAEGAGAATTKGVQGAISDLKRQADGAYGEVENASADPANVRTVQTGITREPIVDDLGRPTGQTRIVPQTEDIAMPVDMRPFKELLAPKMAEMQQWIEPAARNASRGFQAIRSIVQGPDYLPATIAEQGLGGLKSLSREAVSADLRDVNQGIAARIIPDLQKSIDSAVENTAGPKVAEQLQRGRELHAQKMAAADVLNQLRTEPVQVFGQLTWSKDAGIEQLRAVRKLAPSAMPQIGRAYIEQLIDTATHDGGFDKGPTLQRQWENLGSETKRILFESPDQVKHFNNFFELAKMTAEQANPSRTALSLHSLGQGALLLHNPVTGIAYTLGTAGLVRLMYSPAFVKLLSGDWKAIPAAERAALGMTQINTQRQQPPPLPADSTPSGAPAAPAGPIAPAMPPARPGARQPPPVAALDPIAPTAPTIRNALETPATAAEPARLTRREQNALATTGTNAPLETPATQTTIKTETPQHETQPAATARPAGAGTESAGSAEPLRQPAAGGETRRSYTAGSSTGIPTKITVPGVGSRAYEARYKVVELDAVHTSHNGQTFQPSMRYGLRNDRDYTDPANQRKVVDWSSKAEFDPRYHITNNPDAVNGPVIVDSAGNALGGNGRGMILQRVYANNPEGAAAYRQLLIDQTADYGIDPAEVAKMKRPVLVREIPESELSEAGAKQTAITDFNVSGTAALKPSERAIAESRRVSTQTLDHFAAHLESLGGGATIAQALDGAPGVELLDRMIQEGVMPMQERAALVNDTAGKLTPEGKARVTRLMIGRFFLDSRQIDTLPPAVVRKIERVAAPLAKVEGDAEWNLSPKLQQAMQLIEDAKAHGYKDLYAFAENQGLFRAEAYPPDVLQLATHLLKGKQRDLVQAVREYGERAQYAREYQGPGIFGEFPEPQTPEQAYRELLGGKLKPALKPEPRKPQPPAQ